MDWVVIALPVAIVVAVALLVVLLRKRKERNALRSLKERIGNSRQALLRGSNTASFLLLDAAEYGYQPMFQEKLVAIQEDVTLVAFNGSGLVRTGGVAVSMQIGVAGRYRVSSGRIRSKKAWEALAKGRLLLTDKAIVFESDGESERITWGKVSVIETRLDGYEILIPGDPPRTYLVSELDTKFAAILELMLIRTG